MGKFLKNFAFGLLYFLLLPLELVVLIIYGLYGFGVDVVLFIKGAIRFFSGKSFFQPFEEDEKVLEIRTAQIELLAHPNGLPTPVPPSTPAGPSTVYVQQNYYTGKSDGAPQLSNPGQFPNATPIDTTGFFTPSPNPMPSRNQTPIDMTIQQTPGIPIHHVDEVGEERPLIPSDPKHETKRVAIIDLSKMDDGKDER